MYPVNSELLKITITEARFYSGIFQKWKTPRNDQSDNNNFVSVLFKFYANFIVDARDRMQAKEVADNAREIPFVGDVNLLEYFLYVFKLMYI